MPANGCTGARSLSNNLISRNSRSAQSACEPCKGRHYSPAGAYSRQFAFRRGLKDVRLESVMRSIVLQNSQNAVGSISRKSTKQTAIAERCSLQAITEVARESPLDNLVPQMIIRSPRVRPGKPVFSDAKRLLQQYPKRWITPLRLPPLSGISLNEADDSVQYRQRYLRRLAFKFD